MKHTTLLLLSTTLLASTTARAAEASLISKAASKTIYWANGTVNTEAFGGGTGVGDWFNDRTTDSVYYGPNSRANNGSYIILDFTSQMADGYFVTVIAISSLSEKKQYSLYYSADGTTWNAVTDGVGISHTGTRSLDVNDIATHVKLVFNNIGDGWEAGISEIQVYGMDPADVGCRHPSYTEWQFVSGSSTCTSPGKEQRKCTVCGETFERDSELYSPLGHDYVSTLATPGTSSSFGTGSIGCSRCDWSATFNVPLDLITLGGVAHNGLVQFTDLSVSSTVAGAGVGPSDLFDNNWTWGWGAYWIANTRKESEYIQYDFGTEIDLTEIRYSAANRNQTLKFYKWDGETEEPLAEVSIVKDSSSYHQGSLSFRGVTTKGLRMHIVDADGEPYNGTKPVAFSELHAYGTVVGAGKLDVRRSRIILY